MTEQEIYQKLAKQSPTGYKLNELIAFSYPVRRLKLDVLVNKQPDGSLVKVYSVIIKAILSGFNSQKTLFDFLGLGETDEFILRELFSLREKGYLDVVSDKWFVTPEGITFLNDNTIMRSEEQEEYDFLIDAISGEVLSYKENQSERNKFLKFLEPEIKFGNKNPDLLENKFQPLADTYKRDNESKSYLISYSPDEIKRDYEEWCNFWLVEYIPSGKSNQEAKLEVRSYHSLKQNKELTSKFNAEYRHFIYSLSNSERNDYENLMELLDIKDEIKEVQSDFSTLTIWETKQKFIEALKSVKERILIESPWVKRATQEYIPLFQEVLKAKKKIIILYGISEKDEHDIITLKKIEELQTQYQEYFKIIHLPSHFKTLNSKLTGTHRKLVIKDNDYYISGSFNFLSFGKNEKQNVANEESLLIMKDAMKKWQQLEKEYQIKL
jgi:hypothetical protein